MKRFGVTTWTQMLALTLATGAVLPGDPQAALAQNDAGGSGKRVGVETVRPVRRPMTRTLMTPATLMADEQVDLLAKTSGYVEKIDHNIGDKVRRGEVLVKIAVPEMIDELHQAEAVLSARQAQVRAVMAKVTQAERQIETARARVESDLAQRELDQINLQRKQELRAGGAIPQQALDEARIADRVSAAQVLIAQADVAGAEAKTLAAIADVEVASAQVLVAEASVRHLRTLMRYAEIVAPFDGVITARYADHGTFVRSAAEGVAEPLLRVAKMDRLRVAVDVPEVDAPWVRVGSPVDISVLALGEHPFVGEVSRVARALNPATRTMRAEIDLDNSKDILAPGMYADVTIKLETKTDALIIPSKGIRIDGKNTVVLVETDGVAAMKKVELGYDDGIWAEITAGLDVEDRVIVAAGGTVTVGSLVTVASPSTAKATDSP